jgi:hypothetical protein
MCISAAKPLRLLVPALDRLMPGHAVQNSLPSPLHPLFGSPASQHEYGQHQGSANSGECNLSN